MSRQWLEGDALTTAQDRGQQALGGCGDQHQQALARLLQGFQQGIGCRLSHRLSLLNHDHGAAGIQGRASQKTADFTDLLQADLGQGFLAQAPLFGFRRRDALAFFQIGGLHPDQIGMVALLQPASQVRIGLRSTSAKAFEKTAGR